MFPKLPWQNSFHWMVCPHFSLSQSLLVQLASRYYRIASLFIYLNMFSFSDHVITGCAKLSALGTFFSQKRQGIMIYESISSQYEKIFILIYKTKIYKVINKIFQVDFAPIKHSLERFFQMIWNFVISFHASQAQFIWKKVAIRRLEGFLNSAQKSCFLFFS